MDLGLNVFQIIQNELITREGNRSTLGIGFRLNIIEERAKNSEPCARNGQVWKLHHAIRPVTALTLEAREAIDKERQRLLTRHGAKDKDDKDPTKLIRKEEVWEVHHHFPKTVLQFKELQYQPGKVRDLLEYYAVRVYWPDLRPVSLDPGNQLYDIRANLEGCLEELAITLGLNWFRMGGLALPNMSGALP